MVLDALVYDMADSDDTPVDGRNPYKSPHADDAGDAYHERVPLPVGCRPVILLDLAICGFYVFAMFKFRGPPAVVRELCKPIGGWDLFSLAQTSAEIGIAVFGTLADVGIAGGRRWALPLAYAAALFTAISISTDLWTYQQPGSKRPIYFSGNVLLDVLIKRGVWLALYCATLYRYRRWINGVAQVECELADSAD